MSRTAFRACRTISTADLGACERACSEYVNNIQLHVHKMNVANKWQPCRAVGDSCVPSLGANIEEREAGEYANSACCRQFIEANHGGLRGVGPNRVRSNLLGQLEPCLLGGLGPWALPRRRGCPLLSIKRFIPQFNLICSSGARLWTRNGLKTSPCSLFRYGDA